MLTFSSTGAGPDEKIQAKRVIQLRKMLRDYMLLQRQEFPDLPSAYGQAKTDMAKYFEIIDDDEEEEVDNSWWTDDDDD